MRSFALLILIMGTSGSLAQRLTSPYPELVLPLPSNGLNIQLRAFNEGACPSGQVLSRVKLASANVIVCTCLAPGDNANGNVVETCNGSDVCIQSVSQVSNFGTPAAGVSQCVSCSSAGCQADGHEVLRYTTEASGNCANSGNKLVLIYPSISNSQLGACGCATPGLASTSFTGPGSQGYVVPDTANGYGVCNQLYQTDTAVSGGSGNGNSATAISYGLGSFLACNPGFTLDPLGIACFATATASQGASRRQRSRRSKGELIF